MYPSFGIIPNSSIFGGFMIDWPIASRISMMSLAGTSLRTIPSALPVDEKFAEVALDQRGPATFDNFEHVRCFLSHIAHERRVDFVQFALRASQQFVECRREIVGVCARHFLQCRFDAGQIVGQHCLEHSDLPREISVERFLLIPSSSARSSIVTLRNPWLKKCPRAASTIRCRIGSRFRFRG